MTDEQRILNKAIEEQMLIWAAEFVQKRKQRLRQLKAEATGELLNSFEFEADARGEAISMLIAFNEYGRILDMKRVGYEVRGGPGVKAIEDWIKTKNLLAKWIPQFMAKYKRKTIPTNILNQLAWGVIINRTKRALGQRTKQRKWYNAAKTGAINDLYNATALAVSDEAIRLAREKVEEMVYKQNLRHFRAYAKAKGR